MLQFPQVTNFFSQKKVENPIGYREWFAIVNPVAGSLELTINECLADSFRTVTLIPLSSINGKPIPNNGLIVLERTKGNNGRWVVRGIPEKISPELITNDELLDVTIRRLVPVGTYF